MSVTTGPSVASGPEGIMGTACDVQVSQPKSHSSELVLYGCWAIRMLRAWVHAAPLPRLDRGLRTKGQFVPCTLMASSSTG